MRRTVGLSAASALLLAVGLGGPASATQETAVSQLRAEIADLRREYEARLAGLEERLAALEERAAPVATPLSEVEKLRQAAREAAGGAVSPPAAAAPTAAADSGRERNLNRLNPEISFTGTALAIGSDSGREEFSLQEFELDLQAALDPFSRSRWTIAFGEEGVEIEEGYVLYSSLPGGLELTAGKFRQRFGALNRQHLHALPQSTYPLVLESFFGEEGLTQTGLSASWLLPKPWATANEISLQVTSGENKVAFGGELFEDLAVLARLQSFWELSDASYFEWGLSGITGKTVEGGDSRVFGTDFTFNWQPPARAKYRAVTWRAELLRSQRDEVGGASQEAWGGYTYLEGLFRRNLWAGLRLDWAEDPLAPVRRMRGIVPYLTWWQSEFVRLRAEYGYLEDELSDESENRFALQLTWAAGPHKHETY
ncbi:MAG: hypothetical protein ACE5EG_01035 [Thermoanaerobaculia bacterium]